MTRPARTEKLHLRLSSDEKRKLRAAADARGQSLNAFVLDSALVAADEALFDPAPHRAWCRGLGGIPEGARRTAKA